MSAEPVERQVEVDPDLHDGSDSTMGDEASLSQYTASITSSIERYPIENGRRYHAYKEGRYIMPNDEQEQNRLDIAHEMFRICLGGKLFLAPIGDDPRFILDAGTGTGVWAIEMGDLYPSAKVTGTDLSPTQPTWVPENVSFTVDDAEEVWTYREKFDLVHIRYFAGSISDWPQLISQAFENIRPGGFLEIQDFDADSHSEDSSYENTKNMKFWHDSLLTASRNFGKDPSPGPKLKKWFEDAGFVNVVEERFRLPFAPWPKDPHLKRLGAFNLVQMEEGLEGFSLRLFTQVLGWTIDEVQVLLASVRKEMRDPSVHCLYDFYVVHGQKPQDA